MRPSPEAGFKALRPGELLLFKLHAPMNFITGGGFFVRFHQLPVNLAWETFGEANGVRSLEEMRQRIAHYRRTPILPHENPNVGCIMLAEPFFWPKDAWIECPDDFKLNTVQGKGYDSELGTGRALWEQVSERLELYGAKQLETGTAALAAVESKGYGKPQIVLPRLGQGLFRVLVTDAYQKRCAITGERTLPVLDAAHIKPYKTNHPPLSDELDVLLQAQLLAPENGCFPGSERQISKYARPVLPAHRSHADFGENSLISSRNRRARLMPDQHSGSEHGLAIFLEQSPFLSTDPTIVQQAHQTTPFRVSE